MARAILLGNAQDGGVPHAGCACATCAAAWVDPGKRRLVSCLGLIDEEAGASFFVDATPDFPAQLRALWLAANAPGAGPKATLDGILLTHAHVGHYTGLMHLGREVMGARGVPVYATARMAEFLRSNAPWRQLVELENIRLRPLTPGEDLWLTPSLTVTPIPVPHRGEWSDTLAFVVAGPRRRVLYLPDIDRWEAWERPVREAVDSVDVALLDGTFLGPQELPGLDMTKVPHPLVRDSVKLLPGSGRDVRFIHLNHTNPLLNEGPERRWLESEGFRVGEAGDAWEV